MNKFQFNEEYLSQIPALQLLINLGYIYLQPSKIFKERRNKFSNVILEDILAAQLKRINRLEYKGQQQSFSDEDILTAIQKLKSISYDGLITTNQATYDLLTLGTSIQKSIEGSNRSFTMRYVDWDNWENNVFHVAAEFSVERRRSSETARPDIILFVNGIPFAVIECKSPKEEVEQAVSQSIRNQRDDYIPYLFIYSQLLLALNKNEAKYATVGTSSKFWATWKELRDKDELIIGFINRPLNEEIKKHLFSGDFLQARTYFDELEKGESRQLTEQDKVIYSLCRPERLLEIAYKFTIFDGHEKKIARYQQYFVIKSTLERVKQRHEEKRKGGIIWHTQGSGKSLTMVMLTRNLALDPDISQPRIIVVTDREDLDEQLSNTFATCGLDAQRADSGRHLLNLIGKHKSGIVTTLIHKFEKALNAKDFKDNSSDIFVLVDESHRTNFGSFAARMRQMIPNACYLGFTGTPLTKKEKNNFSRFGELIEPHYSIKQAVEDKVVVPLLYEGRNVEITQNQSAIDLWFERHTEGLSDKEKADLKKKYAKAKMLKKAERVIYMQAFDISEHYRANWKNTGFKAQLVAPSKKAAIKFHQFLNEIGHISSAVIMSPPDNREGYEEVDDEPTDEVQRFWLKMMGRYKTEEEYNRQIISRFKSADDPEVLIVVDKLLTGFDAPRNTVLYLCRTLKEHTLLQAIARVNRLFDDEKTGTVKDFGYIIDYADVMGELGTAMEMYAKAGLDGFDPDDIAGALALIKDEIDKLPQRHSDLCDLFKEISNQRDEEAFERLLADEALRDEFYERLREYGKSLSIALSSELFVMKQSSEALQLFRGDLKRFENLKASVKQRYAEVINYRDFEPKIQKLLDMHIQANEVTQLNKPVNIFDEATFAEVKKGKGRTSAKTKAARADMIAHATKKVISEKLEEDPVFYEKFSKLIQKIIDDFKSKRISDLEYLKQACEIREKVVHKQRDEVPEALVGNEDALAYYGMAKDMFQNQYMVCEEVQEYSVDLAITIQDSLKKHWKVHFWNDLDAQNRVKNDVEDFLYDEISSKNGKPLSAEQMDEIIDRAMKIALHRMPE
jgi:type I restriction enzyme, R subunit